MEEVGPLGPCLSSAAWIRWAMAFLTATEAMTSSAAPELPSALGGTKHLVQISPLIKVSATAGSPVANCMQAPA